MTPRLPTLLGLAGIALAWAIAPACNSQPYAPTHATETSGQFLDSSVITTRVKSAILEDPTLKSAQIKVETFKDVVQLSGFVDSAASVQRAGALAAAVKGVTAVRNDLIVK